jgi:hypothetical protein
LVARFRQSGLNLDGEDLRPLSLGDRKEEGFAQKLGLSDPRSPPDPRSATQDCRYCCNCTSTSAGCIFAARINSSNEFTPSEE